MLYSQKMMLKLLTNSMNMTTDRHKTLIATVLAAALWSSVAEGSQSKTSVGADEFVRQLEESLLNIKSIQIPGPTLRLVHASIVLNVQREIGGKVGSSFNIPFINVDFGAEVRKKWIRGETFQYDFQLIGLDIGKENEKLDLFEPFKEIKKNIQDVMVTSNHFKFRQGKYSFNIGAKRISSGGFEIVFVNADVEKNDLLSHKLTLSFEIQD